MYLNLKQSSSNPYILEKFPHKIIIQKMIYLFTNILVFALKPNIYLLLFAFIDSVLFNHPKKRNNIKTIQQMFRHLCRLEHVDEQKCLHLILMRFKFAPLNMLFFLAIKWFLMEVLLDYICVQRYKKNSSWLLNQWWKVVRVTLAFDNGTVSCREVVFNGNFLMKMSQRIFREKSVIFTVPIHSKTSKMFRFSFNHKISH